MHRPSSHAQLPPLRALIVDDEPTACAALRAVLADQPQVSVAGEAGTIAEARTLLDSAAYDLVFLDIQLRGGSGFDLVPFVRPGARIIFVTAYDRHALRAFEVNALDYLMKPVAPERLAAALARVAVAAPAAPARPFAPDDRILLRLGAGSERFVRLADIRVVSSSENYSEVSVGATGERLLVRKTMKAWEDLLPATHFARVHRQTIVNLSHLQRIERVSESTSHLFIDGLAAPVAASYRQLAVLRELLPTLSR